MMDWLSSVAEVRGLETQVTCFPNLRCSATPVLVSLTHSYAECLSFACLFVRNNLGAKMMFAERSER